MPVPSSAQEGYHWITLAKPRNDRDFAGINTNIHAGIVTGIPFSNFTIPQGTNCSELWLALEAQTCYGVNPAYPQNIVVALFPNNGTDYAPDVSVPPFEWFTFSQPNGTWVNMTDSLANGATCSRTRMHHWYHLDLKSAPNGMLTAGAHWISMAANFAVGGTNTYGVFPNNGEEPPALFRDGAGGFTGEGQWQTVMSYGNPIRWTTRACNTNTCYDQFALSLRVYGRCTADPTSPQVLSTPRLPPPTCGLPPPPNCVFGGGRMCVWQCPGPDFIDLAATNSQELTPTGTTFTASPATTFTSTTDSSASSTLPTTPASVSPSTGLPLVIPSLLLLSMTL